MAEYSYGDVIVALGRSKDDDDHDPDVAFNLHVACGRRFRGVVTLCSSIRSSIVYSSPTARGATRESGTNVVAACNLEGSEGAVELPCA